jgi:hypothetical protein
MARPILYFDSRDGMLLHSLTNLETVKTGILLRLGDF